MGIWQKRKGMRRDRILGIPYDNITSEEGLLRVESFIRDGETHTIVPMSIPILMKARRYKHLRIFLEESDLIIPSGRYIFWAAKLLKKPLKELIDSSQFVKMLMVQSADLGKRVYLFGGKGDTIDRAYNNLKKDIPKLFVIGRYRGNYGKQSLEDVITAIGKTSPDYFFIGLGSPFEEIWVKRYRDKINAKLIIMVEGLFKLYAGKMRNFHKFKKDFDVQWMSKREIPHPRYFKKVWLVPVFILSVLLERIFWKH